MIERNEALAFLRAQCAEESVIRHSLASEAVLRALARRLGHNEEAWGLAGLLHDLDYATTKEYPQQHGRTAAQLLEGMVPEAIRVAVLAHNSEYTGVEPQETLDFALRAGETVTGLVSAAALVRPAGYDGMMPSSLKKKMKDKAFAASVSRERIRECEKLGLSLEEFLGLAIEAMTLLPSTL